MATNIFPLPPRTQKLFNELSVHMPNETLRERVSRIEFALLEMCANLEKELNSKSAAKEEPK